MPARSQRQGRSHISPLLVGLWLALLCQLPCGAKFDASLDDPYFEREFQWATFIEMSDSRPYLNYPGSRITPLTVLRVSARTFPRFLDNTATSVPSQIYEEFWYHDRLPIGLRRYSQPNILPYQFGVVVLSPTGNNTVAAANVILRLILELESQRAVTAVVLVPLDKYDRIANELGRYSFVPGRQIMHGQQFSIRLSSYPPSKDCSYFLH